MSTKVHNHFKLTKADIKREILRCGRDPIYFLKTYAKIVHPTRGLVPFDTYDFQDDLLHKFKEHRFNIILKARQLGISTIVAGHIAWFILFHRHKDVIILATKQAKAANMLRKVKMIYDKLPEWLKIAKINLNNTNEFSLKNGCRVLAEATSEDAGRSDALALLVIDECAHTPLIAEIWTSAYSTLSTGGSAIILSCVVGDTFVFTEKGIQQVKDFVENPIGEVGGYKINEYSILGKDKTRKGHLFKNNGKVKTRKIITKFAELEGSLEHKLWAFKDGKYGWYRLSELSKGDYVSYQYGKNVWGNNDKLDFRPKISSKQKNIFTPKKINEDLAYFLGLFLAEGSTYKVKNKNGKLIGGSITLSCGDSLHETFEKLKMPYYYDGDFKYTISSKTMIEFLEHLGFDLSLKAKKKYIPSRLLQMSEKNIIAMMQGIFDGDGWSKIGKGTVGICLSSEKMINQIRIILNNFGIPTEKRSVLTLPTKKVKVESMGYRLEMSQSSSLEFYEKIGFRFKRKQIKKEYIDIKNRNSPNDILPNSYKLVNELYELYGHGTGNLRREHGLFVNSIVNKKTRYPTNNISRGICLKLFNIVKGKLPVERKNEIEKILSEDLQWVKIKSIEEKENYTYDFSLPKTDDFWCHSIIYNGLLGHQTPKGTSNFFHKTCVEAEAGNNAFVLTKLMWWVHPDRDEEWFKNETKNMSEREIAQEMLCNFNASGDTVISGKDIERLEKSIEEPKYKTGMDRNYWIWEEYDENSEYLITVDVARGDGEDYSTINVMQLNDVKTVAEYKGKMSRDNFVNFLNSVANEYHNPMLVVENNNIGITVAQDMLELGYPHLYFSKKGSHDYVDPVQAIGDSTCVPGFTTSVKTRPLVIAKLEEYIRNKSFKNPSSRFVSELKTFIWHNGKPEAQKGYNDDLILSAAIACWVRDTALIKGQRDAEMNRHLLSSITVKRKTLDTRLSNMQDIHKTGRYLEERIKHQRKQAIQFPVFFG